MATTHGYNYVEDALVDVIATMDGYEKEGNNQNIYQSDYRSLRKGLDKYCILEPGTIPEHDTVQYPRRMRTVWNIYLLIFIRFDADLGEINRKLRDVRQEVMDVIDAYPTLNRTQGIVIAQVTSGDEPGVRMGEHNQWWSQRLTISVEERYTATIREIT